MPWQPIQLPTINPYANLADSLLSGMQQGESAKQFKQNRADKLAERAEADKRALDARRQAAYADVMKRRHAGDITDAEAQGMIEELGGQFAAPGAQGAPPPQAGPPQAPVNPLLRAVAAQRAASAPATPAPADPGMDPRGNWFAQQAANPQIPRITPGAPDPNDMGGSLARNIGNVYADAEKRAAQGTRPQVPLEDQDPRTEWFAQQAAAHAAESPTSAAPAPAQNPLARAMQAAKQQDAARSGTLKFRWDGKGPELSISGREEMLAAQKHEKDAQIQEQLAKFDAALAESDDPYLKRNAQTIRAMIRSGEDIRAQDVFSMTSKEVAQEAQDKRQADRLAQQLHLETEVKEPGRMERAKIGARAKIQSSSIIAGAMRYAADKRGEVAGAAAADRKESLDEREAKNYLSATRFQKQVDQGMALGQTLRGLAGGADPEHVLQTRDAQVSLAKFFRGGVPSEGEMGFLYKGIGGLPDKGAQLMRELASGTLSDLQRQNLENAARSAKAEHDALAHETAVGFEKRFRNAKNKQFFRDVAAGYFHPLGVDIPDTFLADAPTADAVASQNPLQRAAAAGKAKDKAGAAQLGGVVERVVTNPERAKELGVPVGSKVKVRKTSGGWEVVQ